jgi:hypothetical protein
MGLDIFHVKPTSAANEMLEYLMMDDLLQNPEFLEKNKQFITSLDDGEGKMMEIMYYSEIGFQRKRMNQRFIHEFENDKLYFRLNDVLHAKHYLEAWSGERQEELERTFQRDFIDTFIEGESVFFISW